MGKGTKPKIGTALLEKGLVTEAAIADALREQKRCGSRLGEALVGQGALSAYQLHMALAEREGLPFADLDKQPCDTALLDAAMRADYLRLRVVPWRTSRGVVMLATPELTQEVAAWASEHFPKHKFVITAPLDISRSVQRFFAEQDDGDARELLWNHDAGKSARTLFASVTDRAMLVLTVAALVGLLFLPGVFSGTFLALNFFFAATLCCKMLFFAVGYFRPVQAEEMDIEDDRALPVYTLLIPMYKEKRTTIGNLVEAIRAIDYPKAKLDVKFIVEADDAETVAHIKEVRPESWFEIIRVPYSQPRTKPKACNYALRFARGEYVTIYDAEDRPDPQQLRKVLAVFRAGPENMACVQARLNYYNYGETLLTRMFALEYASWFNYMLPGLYRLNIPIPLGGTSNHFPTELLRKFYAWDPYNVTEDADLGIRIAHYGYRVGLVDSVTLEEAPVRVGGWLRQRSRWIKGYIQTFIVHMRKPLELYTILGKRGFFGFLFFVGAPALLFLALPFVLLTTAAAFVVPLGLPDWFFWFALLNFVLGFSAHVAMGLMVCRRSAWLNMKGFTVFFPFYWLLHSIASFRAFRQLITRPHYWEKTEHGLSRMLEEGKPEASAGISA